MKQVKYNNISKESLLDIHYQCDNDYNPTLSSMVDIDKFVDKIYQFAQIISIEIDDKLAGMIAIYCNDTVTQRAFITSVCIFPEYRGMGLGSELIANSKQFAQSNGMKSILLEVGKNNLSARKLYEKTGFYMCSEKEASLLMECILP